MDFKDLLNKKNLPSQNAVSANPHDNIFKKALGGISDYVKKTFDQLGETLKKQMPTKEQIQNTESPLTKSVLKNQFPGIQNFIEGHYISSTKKYLSDPNFNKKFIAELPYGFMGTSDMELANGPRKLLSSVAASAIDVIVPKLEEFAKANPSEEVFALLNHLKESLETGYIHPQIEENIINRVKEFGANKLEAISKIPESIKSLAKNFNTQEDFVKFIKDNARFGSAATKTILKDDTELSLQNFHPSELTPTKESPTVNEKILAESPWKDVPPIVNEKNEVLDGNHRLQSAKNAGKESIPVFKITDQGVTLGDIYKEAQTGGGGEGPYSVPKEETPSRFSTPQDLIKAIDLPKYGRQGLSLSKSELKQLIQYLIDKGPDSAENRGIIYKPYGYINDKKPDVILGKIQIREGAGKDTIVAEMTKDGQFTGHIRIHGTPLDTKSIIGKLGDSELLIGSGGGGTTPPTVKTAAGAGEESYLNPKPEEIIGSFPRTGTDYVYKLMADVKEGIFYITNRAKLGIKFWNKVSSENHLDFISKMMRGDLSQMSPALRSKVDEYRMRLDNVWDSISKYTPIAYRDNYFPTFWKDPVKAREYYASRGITSSKSIQGSKSFLKQKIFSDIMDGIKAGLEPITTNPERLVALAEINASKFVAAKIYSLGRRENNIDKFVRIGEAAPEGYAKYDDSFSKVYLPPVKDKAGVTILGEYWGPKEDVQRINNLFSKNWFAENDFGKSIVRIKNGLNALRLGLSGAHFLNEIMVSMGTQFSVGLGRVIIGTLDTLRLKPSGIPKIGAGLYDIAKTPLAPMLYYMDGANLVKDALGLDKTAQAIFKDLLNAGLDPFRNSVYDITKPTTKEILSNARKEIVNYFSNSKDSSLPKLLKSLSVIPGEIFDMGTYKAMSLLFNHYIPMVKIAGAMQILDSELERNSGRIAQGIFSKEELFRRAIRSVDNRFGEINYDVFFMNNTVKSAIETAFRAYGWKYGNIAEPIGAGRDIIENITGYTITFPGGRPKISKTYRPGLTPKIQWVIGGIITFFMVNAIYQKIKTGKTPDSLLDLVQPWDGTMNANGTKHRVNPVMFMKDYITLATQGPASYIYNGLSDEMQFTMDILNNQDFYKNAISDKSEPMYKQFVQVAEYLASQSGPISFQQAIKTSQLKGHTTEDVVESFLGITPASTQTELPPDVKKKNDFITHAKYLQGKINEIPLGSQERTMAQKSLESEINAFLKTMNSKDQRSFRFRIMMNGINIKGSGASSNTAPVTSLGDRIRASISK